MSGGKLSSNSTIPAAATGSTVVIQGDQNHGWAPLNHRAHTWNSRLSLATQRTPPEASLPMPGNR